MGCRSSHFTAGAKKFGGMQASEARRLRELERETARLKRLLADRDLEIDALKELLAKKW